MSPCSFPFQHTHFDRRYYSVTVFVKGLEIFLQTIIGCIISDNLLPLFAI